MKNVQFPKVLADVAILQAKHDALIGLVSQLLKEIHPDNYKNFLTRYDSKYRENGLKNLLAIPQVDAAIVEDLKRQLGL